MRLGAYAYEVKSMFILENNCYISVRSVVYFKRWCNKLSDTENLREFYSEFDLFIAHGYQVVHTVTTDI